MSLFDPGLDLRPQHHAEWLELAAAHALKEGRFGDAYGFADRRCRIGPLAEAPHFLLRAVTLARLGESDASLEDIRRAIEIDPENLIANRSLLRSALEDERAAAAHVILRLDRRPEVLCDAIKTLDRADMEGAGSVTSGHDHVSGWFVWRGTSPLSVYLVWDGGEAEAEVCSDRSHALVGALGSAAEWKWSWPEGATWIKITIRARAFLLFGDRLGRPAQEIAQRRALGSRGAGRIARPKRGVAVILPVYDDYEATRMCLATLLHDRPEHVERNIVIVDDCTPNERIARLLDAAAETGHITLVRNEDNLGFAASVNRALRMLDDEDVLLLNADTIVPPGFVDRLSRAAHGSDDIGTVTPLSNNGESTSFPLAFRENPLPTLAEVIAIDRIAARVNAGGAVDLPSGTGFCLYITRACLDWVPSLGEQFGRGYYEDIDFCLRADAAGLRNVCATNVYVGHAGSKSFKGQKRSLVVRNQKLIEQSYPGYDRTSAIFMNTDPLKPARQAIELEQLKALGPAHLFVISESVAPTSIQDRLDEHLASGFDVLIARVETRAGELRVSLSDGRGGSPQSVEFRYPLPEVERKLTVDLSRLTIERAEIVNVAEIPAVFVQALCRMDVRLSLYVNDCSFVCPLQTCGRHTDCSFCRGNCPRASEQSVLGAAGSLDAESARPVWIQILEQAQEIVVPSDEIRRVLESHSSPFISRVRISSGSHSSGVLSLANPANPERLAVVAPDTYTSTFKLLNHLARQFAAANESVELVVLGSTFDDLRLMASRSAFVTGALAPEEVRPLLSRLRVGRLFFPTRRGRYDHWRAAAESTGLPAASFSWLADADRGHRRNLALHPAADAVAIARDILDWMRKPIEPRGINDE